MPLCGKRIRASRVFDSAVTKGIWRMQLSHVAPVRDARFDDPGLVSTAGLVPVLALAQRAGLVEWADALLTVPGAAGAAAGAKVATLVGGMVAGADSITDMGLVRHGAMPRLFTGMRAPSTLGVFLRALRFGHVRQLDSGAARVLAGLAQHSPLLPSAASELVYLDIDDTVRQTYGYGKQGAGFGYSGIKGLNALLATASSTACAPVIVAARLRRGSVHSARGRPGRRRDQHLSPCRRARQVGAGRGFGFLRLRRHRRRDASRRALLRHRRQDHGGHGGDRLDPGGRVDAGSATRVRSSTSNCSSRSPPPKSPRCPSSRSPPAAPPTP
jgi:hypothetical protein